MTKCAVITGASRGIGKAIAERLAAKGFSLVLNFKNSREMAEDLAKKLGKQFGVEAFTFQADVSEEKDVEKLVEFSLKTFKKIDVLINNAGICDDREFDERTVSCFEKTFKVNLFGVFHLSKLIGREMKNAGGGKIVNISSNNAFNCFYPTTVDYDASKAALNSLTKNLAIEFSPEVNVNAVAPGWIDTDMNKSVLTEDVALLESERILKKRIGRPEDVANLVAFLVSDEAEYINGEIIVIDGGVF